MSRNEEKGKLFVGGLSWDTTQASLLQYFSRYGEVIDCVVVTNPTTGKSRGFGFVNFKDPSCVETVLAAGPHMLDGKQIDPNGSNRKKVGKAGGKENSRKKLFVGGLPPSVDEQQLREGFSKYGKVNDVVIVYDQQKQKPRGFGFLTFEDEDSVQRIVQERFVLIAGKQVECKRAEPKDAVSSQLAGAAASVGGPMILAQAADGSVGLVPASALQASASLLQANAAVGPAAAAGGVSLLPSTNLPAAAAAYRAHDVLQQSLLPAGFRYVSPNAAATAGSLPASQYVLLGGGVNGSNVPGGVGAVAGGGLMMLNGAAAVNPAASGLLMPNTPTAGNTGMLMHRPVMLPSAGSPATAGYVLAGGAGATAPTLPVVPQYVVGYPQQTGTSQDLTAMYGAANPYGISLPPAAVYAAVGKPDAAAGLLAQQSADVTSNKVSAQPAQLAASYNIVSGGEASEDGVAVSDCQTAAAAAVGGGSQLSHGISPALGYYLLPGYQSPYSSVAGGSALYTAGDPYIATASGGAAGRIGPVVSATAHSYHPYRR